MRAGVLLVLFLCAACGTRGLRQPAASAGPPAENECAVDVVNGSSLPMAVVVYSRSANDLGILEPSRTVRYVEECTPRSWTVTGIPRSVPGSQPTQPPSQPSEPDLAPPTPERSGPVSQTVDVRPGTVVQVVL